MQIYFDQENQVSEELLETMKKAASLCVKKEGLDEDSCEVSVSFVSGDEIHTLNREYRGVDRVTDVLSFPQYEGADEIQDVIDMIGTCELGDVVICRDRARQQAEEFGHSFERELIYLFVHSILHLLGYDHMQEEEKKVMRAREEEIMDELGIPRRTDRKEEGGGALTEEQKTSLFRKAMEASRNAYAPYSHYHVGAALLAEDGQIFTGVNVENASYPAGICAERSAGVQGVTAGYRKFTAIAVASPDGEASMCGICRQFFTEFSKDMIVIYGEDEAHLKAERLSALLPSDFVLPEKER